jgi:hypothetical protein
MQSIRNPWLFVLALQASLFCAPVYPFCGFYAGKADATLFNAASQVVVVRDGNRTVLSMLNDYRGPLSEFALIVPTPVVLQRGQVRVAEKAVFEHLDAYSSPRLVEYNDSDPCRTEFTWGQNLNVEYYSLPSSVAMPMSTDAEPRDRALGVTVDARYTLEEYDIVSLSAKRSDGLETWLRENGYRIPAGASAALKPYINQGMKFFVAKVNLKRQSQSGYTMLRPLQFAFESEKFMLPMRLGMLNAPRDEAQDLIIYILTRRGRVESSNYRTTGLPTGVNLPAFIKPKFQDFYRAMFDTVSKREDYRGVFTEYFWDMSWCDPCAAEPLSREELEKSGVFWLHGDVEERFKSLQNPTIRGPSQVTVPFGGAVPVMLTRLHVRYTPRTFPEDLMFTQTNDQSNWQARYIVQNPYGGSVAECSEKVALMNCTTMCDARVSAVRAVLGPSLPSGQTQGATDDNIPSVTVRGYTRPLAAYRGKSTEVLRDECVATCRASKAQGLDAAMRYYQKELPERVAAEKQTLARLTNWSLHDIDAMPGAQRFSMASPEGQTTLSSAAAPAVEPWWRKLFAK